MGIFNSVAIKAFLAGLGVTVALQVGAALVSLGSVEDVEQWGRTALLSLAGAVGAYITTYFQRSNLT